MYPLEFLCLPTASPPLPPLFKNRFAFRQDSVKSLLLQGVGTDPSRLVRNTIAALIAKLAKVLFATPQGWQEVGVRCRFQVVSVWLVLVMWLPFTFCELVLCLFYAEMCGVF